jgi:hypothetical protein
MNKLLNFAKGADLETGISMTVDIRRNANGEAYLHEATRLADGIDPPLIIEIVNVKDKFSESEVSRIIEEAKQVLTSSM